MQRGHRFLNLLRPAGADQRGVICGWRSTQAMAICAQLTHLSNALLILYPTLRQSQRLMNMTANNAV